MNAQEADRLAIDHTGVDGASAGERANDADGAARTHLFHLRLELAGATDLDDQIDTGAAGLFQNLLIPFWLTAIIDQCIGPQCLGTVEFLLAARGEKGVGAMHLRKGKCKTSPPASAEYRNGLAGLDPSGLHDSVPRG